MILDVPILESLRENNFREDKKAKGILHVEANG
jgi:hypothetical protein